MSVKGTYGSEDPGTTRYRLSFTVGGLLEPQGRILAGLFVNSNAWPSEAGSGFGAEHNPADAWRHEAGDAVAAIRRQAIDDNVLAIRTVSGAQRYVGETLKRLSALTFREISLLADDAVSAPDRRLIMWSGMCRYYAFVGRFAEEVLREQFLAGSGRVARGDYDVFFAQVSLWHPELTSLSEATARKLRINLFTAMREAELIDRTGAIAAPLLDSVTDELLQDRPDLIRLLPLRG